MRQVRQGDVLLERVEQVPAGAVRQASGARIVLAEGEATGHAHAVESEGAAVFTAPDGRRYLVLTRAAQLEHEEHAPIALEPGAYRVVRQREFDPRVHGIRSRKVAD